MNKKELLDRLTDFPVRIIKLTKAMPSDISGRTIGKQIVASGTSIVANLEEAFGTVSHRDFLNKYVVALKEARETLRWLKILDKAEMVNHNLLDPLLVEADEIVAILASSVKTIQKNLKSHVSRNPRPRQNRVKDLG